MYPAILQLALLQFLPSPVSAQIRLVDPCIPDSEVAVYTVNENGSPRQTPVEERTVRKNDSSGGYYEISIHSSETDQTAKARAADFFVYNVVSVNTFNKAAVRRSVSLVENNAPLKGNEIAFLDYSTLAVSLRGFPFASCAEASLVILGVENSISMKVTNSGRERIAVSGRDYDCYRLEIGLAGFWGRLLPKSRFWYAAAAPHQLVRFEGSKAGPGSPTRTLMLKEYSVKKR